MSGRRPGALRHQKGNQIPVTLYLPRRHYWLLKSLSARSGFSMQFFLRRALYDVLIEVNDRLDPRALKE
jgi:hypothetical protein